MEIIAKLAATYWRLLLELSLVVVIGLLFHAWQDTKAEYIRYGAGVEALGEQAIADKATVEAQHKTNLEIIKRDYETKLPQATASAVAAYRTDWLRRHSGSSAMPSDAQCQPVNDGAGREPVSDRGCADEGFIQRAARDALRLEQWRAWCERNRCPVE
jgi:hypothetical protein